MPDLSQVTLKNYEGWWSYLKTLLTDITNVDLTIKELNAIEKSKTGKPLNTASRKNYLSTVMYQVKDKPDVYNLYKVHMKDYCYKLRSVDEKQLGAESVKRKIKGLNWAAIVAYKNMILEDDTIPDDTKLLVRLYTELDAPVRNNFVNIRVFIDEPRPIDFVGNCLLLTRSPIVVKKRKLHVIKRSVGGALPDGADVGGISPIRNILWLQKFKTSKHESISDIIQSIPDALANDIIKYCTSNNMYTLFGVTANSLVKRLIAAFEKVSHHKIGINVLRHLSVMDFLKDTPYLDERRQKAAKMGHSVYIQELYRVRA